MGECETLVLQPKIRKSLLAWISKGLMERCPARWRDFEVASQRRLDPDHGAAGPNHSVMIFNTGLNLRAVSDVIVFLNVDPWL